MWYIEGTRGNIGGGTNRNIWKVSCIVTMVPEFQEISELYWICVQ